MANRLPNNCDCEIPSMLDAEIQPDCCVPCRPARLTISWVCWGCGREIDAPATYDGLPNVLRCVCGSMVCIESPVSPLPPSE